MEEERITRIEKHIAELHVRLKHIEENFTKEINQTTEDPSIDEVRVQQAPLFVQIPPSSPKEPTPQGRGGIWLASVGMFFFLLAVSFFIKLAIDSGWLTPVRQLCGAVLFGVMLIGAGARLRQRDAAYSTFLPAAGLVVLFMAVYGGHLYWELYPQSVAMIFVGIIALFALYLFRKFQHDFFLIASVCGSYLVPLLLEDHHNNPFEECAYFLFWDLLYCFFSIALGRRLLIGLIAYLSLGVWQILFGVYESSDLFLLQAALFQAIQFILLAGAVAFFSIKHKVELAAAEAWAFFPTLLLFYAIEYSIFSQALPKLAPWIVLGFGFFLFGVYTWARVHLKKQALNSEPVLATFIAISFFHALYLEILPAEICPWLGVALIPFLGWLSRTRFTFDRFWPVYFLIAGVVFGEYFKAIPGSFSGNSSSSLLVNFLFFSTFFWGYSFKKGGEKSSWLILLATVQILVGLERLATQCTSLPTSLYFTSGAWALLGMGMLLVAHRWKDSLLARGSMGVLAIVAAKVLFVDISSNGSITRILALLVIGALLYVAGLLWRRVGEWKEVSK